MLKAVYDQIMDTIGKKPPECGGILGAGADGVISDYYFDVTGRSEPNAYVPDVEAVNQVLEAWHERGVHMVGIVHSHQDGLIAPSCGDIAYGVRILDALDALERFYLPIVTSSEENVKINGFLIEKKSGYQSKCHEIEICCVNEAASL